MKTIEVDIFHEFVTHKNVIILHVANCFHTMGGGIAKIVKDKFHKAYEADCATLKGDKSKLGTYSFAKVDLKQNRYIANLYAQFTYGQNHFGDRELSYDALYNSVKKLLNDIENSEIQTVLIPYGIGCGLAKGNWNIVEKILDELTDGCNKECIVCKLPD
jgi:O-acetyl-ADP-ribose deacetylase (regulator of RNase III)